MPIFSGKHDLPDYDSGPYKVQVLDRAVAILELLANSTSEMSLGELTSAIGLHKSTVHRLLMVLEAHRLVDKSPIHGRYRLGIKLFELGNRAVANLNLRERAHERLEWLVAQTGEAAQLSIMDRGEMLCIDKVDPEHCGRAFTQIGLRIGVHCSAVGKAMLSHLGEQAVRDILRVRGMASRTPFTVTSADQYIAELEIARQRGYSVANEEAEKGVHCIADAIVNRGGTPIAAIGISGSALRFTPEYSETVAKTLRTVTRELSEVFEAVGNPPDPTRN